MKIAVVGASGFLGRHVMTDLTRRDIDAVATARSVEKLAAWRDQARILALDIGDAGDAALDELAACDAVIHLAWGGLPNYRSLHHFEVELPRQYFFLKRLAQRGLRSLVVAGTCFEYGLQTGELSEECASSPATPYGLAKDTLRRELEFLRGTHPFALTWARLFYTYGEGQPATSLYPQLVAAAARGDRSFDMSGGEQLRDYLPVADVARALIDLAIRRGDAGIVNVCAGRGIAIRELVESWMRTLGCRLELNLGKYPYLDYEPMAFWGARRKLDRLCYQS